MSQQTVHVDPDAVLRVAIVRAGQQYQQMLDEIARLTVYAQLLEQRVAELEAPPTD